MKSCLILVLYMLLSSHTVSAFTADDVDVDAPAVKKTYLDLYNDFISLPQPRTLFSEVVCKAGDMSLYRLVDVSNGTPAFADIDCGAYNRGIGQLIHVIPFNGDKVSFYVELIKSGDMWIGTVFSDDAKRLKKRYQWDDRGLQGSLRDIRSDVDYTGTYKDNKLVGTARMHTPAGDITWENDGKGNVTSFRLYFKDGVTLAVEGKCNGGYCPIYDDGRLQYTYQVKCYSRIEHRCTFDIIEQGLNLD